MVQNIVIVTSVIDPPNTPLCYYKIRSIFSKSERLDQTIKTLDSIKQNIPNVYIILVECSTLQSNEIKTLTDRCDLFVNLINNINVLDAINHKNKSYGECSQLIEGLNMIPKNVLMNAVNLFKLSGRYYLTDNFKYDEFNNNECVVKPINNKRDNINTVFYKIPVSDITSYIDFLVTKKESFVHKMIGIEVVVAEYYSKRTNVIYKEHMNAEGLVSINGQLWKG